ncbi:MAG TPA: thermonuclease family protein [Planctomycetaceae bacterium]|nr:thermonuclease family protein [Planctomycetaceae bacterium]HQZ67213.1 thermonuclease family protein [Planctomycetaceae bacterium]HRA89662.1 thermonuclease family protein [Planctomycetaceae bacterium]
MDAPARRPKVRRSMSPATIAILIFAGLTVLRLTIFAPELASDGKPRTSATVKYVIDGDTFDLDDGTRIRMLGINAPEAGFGDKVAEPHSAEATEWLRNRIHGRQMLLRIDYPKTDRYGRTLAWVFEPDGTLVNRQMLLEGKVKLLADFGLPPDLESSLREAESEARILKLGVWGKKPK